MENELIPGNKNMVSLISNDRLGDLIKPLSHEIHLFDTYVAGTARIKDESLFEDIKEGVTLKLKRDPENRFDENSIIIYDGKERELGYIPEKDNVVFARLMDAGKYLTAKVKDHESKGGFRQIKIGIYLIDF